MGCCSTQEISSRPRCLGLTRNRGSSVQKAKALPKGQMSPLEWGQPFSLCLLRQNAPTFAILQPEVLKVKHEHVHHPTAEQQLKQQPVVPSPSRPQVMYLVVTDLRVCLPHPQKISGCPQQCHGKERTASPSERPVQYGDTSITPS